MIKYGMFLTTQLKYGMFIFPGPNSISKYSIDQQADGSFMVTYIPVEVGLFDINVTWNGNEIAGKCCHGNNEKCQVQYRPAS